MPRLLILFASLLYLLIPISSSTADTILAGQALDVNDKLISKNGMYALGFFQTSGGSSHSTTSWYVGIWFNTVPKFTSAWVANRDNPIKNSTSLELTISQDGNLVILNRSANSMLWSTQSNITRNGTTVMLLNSGNLVLANSSNSSQVLWQSFDHPTDTFFPGAKLGWDKASGLNRRLVSWKNSMNPASGAYSEQLDPNDFNQYLLVALNSSTSYWWSGVWNGEYFASVPEMASRRFFISTYVNNDQEKYFTYDLVDKNMVTRTVLDVSGQAKGFIWFQGSQDWVMTYAQPKSPCDVYAVCGPFTICSDDVLPHCNCMEGFTVTSHEDWELDDRTGGCSRNTPLDCISNKTITRSTDKFYSIPCAKLPQNAQKVETATNASDCAQVCLNNCSCTAYSFGNGGCSTWHNDLLNVKQLQCSGITNSSGEALYLRLSAKDVQSSKNKRRGIVVTIVIGGISAVGLFAIILLLMIWRNKKKSSRRTLNGAQGCNGLIVFSYTDLQRATKNFTEKLGRGGFGSVFKGFVDDSTSIAVKSLDHAYQGEKQFRAEVSSIGTIQHINLVKLVGFCCEGSSRLLVYEHMSNLSLDTHLFRNNSMTLNWPIRYQIALGVARGLAYLHESCRDCIIHCDIKPENILLDASFIPKIADFGMAKLLGRDFSQVLTMVRGTAGYLAPEWITGVAVTPKVDVYSYGMVLLEIISGRRNSSSTCSCDSDHAIYFPVHAAHKLLEKDIGSLVDPLLHGDVNMYQVELVCKVACWCIQDDEFARPPIRKVVQILEGLIEITTPPMPRLLQTMTARTQLAPNDKSSCN